MIFNRVTDFVMPDYEWAISGNFESLSDESLAQIVDALNSYEVRKHDSALAVLYAPCHLFWVEKRNGRIVAGVRKFGFTNFLYWGFLAMAMIFAAASFHGAAGFDQYLFSLAALAAQFLLMPAIVNIKGFFLLRVCVRRLEMILEQRGCFPER